MACHVEGGGGKWHCDSWEEALAMDSRKNGSPPVVKAAQIKKIVNSFVDTMRMGFSFPMAFSTPTSSRVIVLARARAMAEETATTSLLVSGVAAGVMTSDHLANFVGECRDDKIFQTLVPAEAWVR